MKIKIPSQTHKERFIYAEIIKNKNADTLAVFLSGFSGGKELPLFKKTQSWFIKKGFDTFLINFCNDDVGQQKKNALLLEQLSFSVYTAELKNVLDRHAKNYRNLVFIGHSFGAIISIIFLQKYKKYRNIAKLVLWDPTLLPWKKEWMEEDFTLNKEEDLYIGKQTPEILNRKFYRECITADTAQILGLLNHPVCIIAAENSADKDARKYFSKLKHKKTSVLHIIKKTNHFFDGRAAQKELIADTFKFLN